MQRLQNLSIRARLYGLIAVAVVGFAAVLLLTSHLSRRYEISGPLYERLMARRNAMGAFEPAHLSLVGAEIAASHLLLARDDEDTRRLLDQFAQAQRLFADTQASTRQKLFDGPVKQALGRDVYPPAEEYFRLASSDFLP